jgi:hypothetical protein
MDLLKLTELPKGATSSSPDTYDESKANPFPKLPDPLVAKNGKKVATAEADPQSHLGGGEHDAVDER